MEIRKGKPTFWMLTMCLPILSKIDRCVKVLYKNVSGPMFRRLSLILNLNCLNRMENI